MTHNSNGMRCLLSEIGLVSLVGDPNYRNRTVNLIWLSRSFLNFHFTLITRVTNFKLHLSSDNRHSLPSLIASSFCPLSLRTLGWRLRF